MTATLAASQAILKERYPDGQLPALQYSEFPFLGTVENRTDFTGDDYKVALQNEGPQGASADFQTALGSLQQGAYNAFKLTRVEHFSLARIKGQALRAAQGRQGALVDLWTNETNGASQTELEDEEIYCFGDGTGIRARVATTATVSSTSVALSDASDATKLRLGMRIQLVSDATTSPTLRVGYAKISGIDRTNGTITFASALNGLITTATAGDYIVRAGDSASAGTSAVISGMKAYIAGGTSPGTLFQLNRNSDPTRLAGQVYDMTGVPMEEAITEALARVTQQGSKEPRTVWGNPRDLANWKKSLGAKTVYTRTTVEGTQSYKNKKGAIVPVMYGGIQIEGEAGPVTVMSHPFISRGDVFLVDMESLFLASIGPVPHMFDYDSNDFLRVASDDAYEVRFGSYAQFGTNRPVGHIRGTGFGQ